MKIFFLLLITVVSCFCGMPGSTSLAFLKISPSARETAMGEASTAISEGAQSIYFNPSRIYLTKLMNIHTTYAIWFENIYFASMFFAHKLKNSSIGLSMRYLGMDEIDVYDDDGNPVGRKYTSYDFLMGFSYATSIELMNRKFLIGGSFKFITEVIEEERANVFAFDFGLFYKHEFFVSRRRYRRISKLKPSPVLDFGFVVNNLGPKVKFKEEGFLLPISCKFGVGYRPRRNLLVASDFRFPIDNIPSCHIGLEWIVKRILALRCGYRTLPVVALGPLSGLSVGFGLKLKMFNFDYTFVPYGKLGFTHRFSASANF